MSSRPIIFVSSTYSAAFVVACSGPVKLPAADVQLPAIELAFSWEAVPELSNESLSTLADGSVIRTTGGWGAADGPPIVTAAPVPTDKEMWSVGFQSGQIVTRALGANEQTHMLIDLSPELPIERGWNDEGLTGIAFDPNFANGSPYIYVGIFLPPPSGFGLDWREGRNGILELRRYDCAFEHDNVLRASPSSKRVILRLRMHEFVHHAGAIRFDDTGMLFLSVGDGGFGSVESQDPFSLRGKLLRLDVRTPSADRAYSIPPSNPFADGVRGAPEVWALGFRNPWQFSVDRTPSGELVAWVGDVGSDHPGEINLVRSGDNAGWPFRENDVAYDIDAKNPVGGPFTDPVSYYSTGCSVAGGQPYLSQDQPLATGLYIFADTCGGWAAALDRPTLLSQPEGTRAFQSVLPDTQATVPLPVGFAANFAGELYVISYAGGLHRMRVSSAGFGDNPPPALLSESRYHDPRNPDSVPSEAISFAPTLSFFSDYAQKNRWVILPEGSAFAINDDGRITTPVGTEFVKVMRRDGRLLETRVLRRRNEERWDAFTYVWRDDQTDADLTTTAVNVEAVEPTWRVPTQSECMSCHTRAAEFVLGFELEQFTAQALESLRQQGAFAEAPQNQWDAARAARGTVVSTENLDSSLTQRARSYLHVNCAHCHLPDGPTSSPMDLRLTTPFASAAICNAPITRPENAHRSDALLVAPGDSQRSFLLHRMQSLPGNEVMPPLRVQRDDVGFQTIELWIDGLAGCL